MRGGIYAATVTPVSEAFVPDDRRAIPYYRDLLERGCDGLTILGTTGEAMSFSLEQRLAFMDAVAGALPAQRVTCGTGAASLADAVRLTQAAGEYGFAAALVMPPFFYRDATDDGVVRFYDALLAQMPGRTRIVLYNFPKMSGITLSAALVERLERELTGTVVGVKESSNDRALQSAILERCPHLLVFPGSEAYLVAAKAYGAAGCISGSVALWPQLAREVFHTGDAAKGVELARLRGTLDGEPFIAGVRRRIARERADEGWERMMPPL